MELKPCLKCHSKNVHYLEEEYHPLHQLEGIIVCDDCELEVKCTPEQWNTRATDPLLKEMVEALEKAVRSVCELIGDSRGVDGLHLNGDIAEWDSLRTGGNYEGWLIEFDEAQEFLQKYRERLGK